jgi:hypothetical protein
MLYRKIDTPGQPMFVQFQVPPTWITIGGLNRSIVTFKMKTNHSTYLD